MSYHHGNLKDSLIQAGDEELKLHGPENLSLREIAKRAGVSHNAPYRHFKSKMHLIDSIVEKTLTQLAEQILAAPLLYPASLLMQLQYVGRLWAHLAIHYPRKSHLIFAGLSQPAHHKAYYRLIYQNMSALLEAARGQELPAQISCGPFALTLIASFRGLGLMYTSQTAGTEIDSPDALLDLYDQLAENILASTIPLK